MRQVNLGCGLNRLDGWENYDSDVDLTKPLPWEDNSIDFILLEHVLEHLTPQQGYSCLKECYRVLTTGGTLRVIVPEIYRILMGRKHHPEYNEFVKTFGFDDAVDAIIYGHGHQSIFSEDLLRQLLTAIGFRGEFKEADSDKTIDGHWRIIGTQFDKIESFRVEAVK